jgi:hypothetical protein
MPVPPRAERLAFFVYQDPIWSAGDRLHVTFEFESDAALRAGLAPLSLDWLADAKLLEDRIQVLDAFEVDADVFGNVVTLTLGPEDKYEHLGAEDYDRAEALEARFHAAGLLPHLGDRLHLDDWSFPASPLPPPPPPPAPGPPRFLVEILEPASDGWIVDVRERLGGRSSSFGQVPLTAESRVVDLGATTVADMGSLVPGEIAIATITMGPGPDGMMRAVVDRLERIRPEPALVAEIAAAYVVLKGAGVLVDLAPPEEIARAYLLRREVFPDFSVEALLDTTLEAELLGRTVEGYPWMSNHVGWALLALRKLALPCQFSAHRALTEAIARCRQGEPPERVREELLGRMLAELHHVLEGAGDPRRFLPARLRTRPEVVISLLLTDAQRRALVSAGLLLSAP